MSVQDLRKKMKASPVAALESQDQQLEKAMGTSRDRGDVLKIENGRNVFRIYPPHEEIDPVSKKPCTFAEEKVVTYLPAMVKDYDSDGKVKKDSNGNDLMKLGRKPVFNAKIHGRSSKDAVEEFIRIALENAKLLFPDNEDERKKFLLPIYGQYSKDPAARINGITYNAGWAVYADKIVGDTKTFGKLEFGKAVKQGLNSVAAIEGGDDPMGTDPFTDIDEGRAVIVLFDNKATQASDYYKVAIDPSTETVNVNGRDLKVQKTYPLSDKQIEDFYKHDSLAKIYRNVFTRKDLELQIEGLRRVEEQSKTTQGGKYELGVFDSDEFQNILEQLCEIYPAVSEDDSENTTQEEQDAPMSAETPAVEEKEEEVETTTTTSPKGKLLPGEDEFDLMERDELKAYAKDNNTGVLVRPAAVMPDEMLREALRTWKNSQGGVEEVKAEVTSAATESTERPMTAKERLDALKAAKS